MNGSLETALRVAALAVSLVFLAGATTDRFSLRKDAPRDAASAEAERGRHFHGGKSGQPRVPDVACQSQGCHGDSPHKEDRSVAAFLNMHGSSVGCFACHAKNAEDLWGGSHEGGDGRKIRVPLPQGTTEPHTLLGKPIACRQCHSEGGRARLAGRGIAGLPGGFSDPIPLRMLERGGKRWDPAEIR